MSAYYDGKNAGNKGHDWASANTRDAAYKSDFERGKQDGLREKKTRDDEDEAYRKRTQTSAPHNASQKTDNSSSYSNYGPTPPMHWLLKTVLSGIGAMVIAIGELNASIPAIFAAILVIGINLGLHFLDLKIEKDHDPKYEVYKKLLFIVYGLIILYFVKALFGRYFRRSAMRLHI